MHQEALAVKGNCADAIFGTMLIIMGKHSCVLFSSSPYYIKIQNNAQAQKYIFFCHFSLVSRPPLRVPGQVRNKKGRARGCEAALQRSNEAI